MKIKRSYLSVAVVQAIGLAAMGAAGVVLAQTPAPTTNGQPQKIEKIEVTGSNIKRVDAEGAAPIQVITREEIARSGFQSVTELLRSIPSNSTVGALSDLTGNNSFSGGASSISLRGLNSASTLVLLNGRRISAFGLANPNFGQGAIVNVDALPLAVIDRIEILKDGASAIYGSEAIAGVVNFILRKDYQGILASGSFSQSADSEYRTYRASATAGFGDLSRDRYNGFINYERYQREQTRFRDVGNYLNREILATTFSTGVATSTFAGNFYETNGRFIAASPNCPAERKDAAGVCIYDQWVGVVIAPKNERDTLFLRGSFDITANASLFGELSFGNTKTTFVNNPAVAGFGAFVPFYNAAAGQTITLPVILPVGHPANPYNRAVTYRHRFEEIGPSKSITDAQQSRIVVGAKATLGSWDLEGAVFDARNDTELQRINSLRTSGLIAAFSGGAYNFLNPSAGTLKPSDLKIDAVDKGKSSFAGFDFKGSSELFQMPSGPLSVAAGLDYRREKFSATPDEAIVRGEVAGNGASAADGSRSVTSLYAEFSIPVVTSVEVQLAGRFDKFSDYGNSKTPKIGATWKPFSSLKLRGNYSGGFRAPSLTEISKSSVSAFLNNYIDPRRCPAGLPRNIPDCTGGYSLPFFIVANPNVQPEKSKTSTLGLVWEPIKDGSVTLDFFDIKRKNEITFVGIADLVDNEFSSDTRYAGRITRDPADADGRPGRVISARSGFLNSGETKVRGLDLETRYNLNMAAAGKLSFVGQATYYMYNKQADDDGVFTQFIGTRNLPRARATTSLTWEQGVWTATTTARFVAGTTASGNVTNPCNLNLPTICDVSSLTTFDINGSWKGIKDLSVSFGVQNVGGRKPPLDPVARPVNVGLHGAALFGPYYTLAAEYKFR